MIELAALQQQLRDARRRKAPAGSARLEPSKTPMRIALGADHGGVVLKRILARHLDALGYEVVDCGTHNADPVDYPDIALAVAQAVGRGQCARGIVIDAAGLGSCMVANKVPGVRAATCWDEATVRNSRAHNDANVLALGASRMHPGLARRLVRLWLATDFEGGRHARRVDKIVALDAGRRA